MVVPVSAAAANAEAVKEEVEEEVEEEEEEDVPLEVREHVGEIGRHYKAVSKRHIFCLMLLAAASIWLENDDWG
jgi:hypothetical protein